MSSRAPLLRRGHQPRRTTTLKITQSKNGYSLRVQYEERAPYVADIYLARRLRQTGRDQAVSDRGRWAEAQLRYTFKDAVASRPRADASQRVQSQQRASRVSRRLVLELRDCAAALRASSRRHRRRLEPRSRGARQGADARGHRPAARRRRALDARSRRAALRRRAARGASSPTPSKRCSAPCCLTAARRRQKLSSISCSPSSSRACPMRRRSRIRRRGCRSGCKAGGLPLPSYVVTAVHGRDHEQTFIVECEVREKNAHTTGHGQSRRAAEQEAAAAMLVVLTGEQH